MEKKSNSGLIAAIVILVVIIIGLIGYIIYDKEIAPKLEVKDGQVVENGEVKDSALTHGDALTIGKELWDYAFSAYWGGKPAWSTSTGEVNEAGGQPIVCDTTADEVKKKFSKDFKGESCLSDGVTCANYGIDDFVVSCTGAGRGSLQDYKETNLEVGTVQENEIVFTAISEYCGGSFCHESDETVRTVSKDFIISRENDEWVIKYFYLPN